MLEHAGLRYFMIAVGAVGILSASVEAKADAEGSKVILLTVTDKCTYCARHRKAFLEKANALGMSVDYRITDYDAALQAQQVEWAIGQDPDAIVLWPAVLDSIVPSLRKVYAAGIPLVLTNSKPQDANADLWDVYTGPNDIANGELAAKGMIEGFAAKGFGVSGRIIMIEGPAGSTPQIQRAEGFECVLGAQAPGISIVGKMSSEWNEQAGAAAATALFAQVGTDIQGIYGQDDNVLAGAIEAARDAGLDPQSLVLVGSDCNANGVAGLVAGIQYASVLQSAIDDGEYAAQAAADLLDGKSLPKEIYLPHVLVTSDNVGVCQAANAQ